MDERIEKPRNPIIEGKIFPALIKFTIPLALAFLLQALYGAVDLIVVGQFGSTASVSAVANGSQIMRTVTDIVLGLSMGVTVMVGHAIGAGDDEKAACTVGAMVKLFTVTALVLSLGVALFARQLAALMHVPADAVAKTIDYLHICGVGMIFVVAYNAISSLFRGIGDSKSPLLFIFIAALANVVLDLLFVGVFHMDVAGAALATILAQAISVAFSLIKMLKGGLPFKVEKRHFKNTGKTALGISKIGAPLAFQQLMVSGSFLIIMAIVNNVGLVESASIGIAEKMFVFLAMVPLSFMSSLSAFTAQNIGAKREDRAIKALKMAMIVSVIYGTIMTYITMFHGQFLAGFFDNDPLVIQATGEYLRGASPEYILIAITFCLLGYFNGLSKTTFVLLEGLVTSFCVRIPLSFYFSTWEYHPLFMIALSVTITAIIGVSMCIVYYFIVKKQRRNLDKQ